MLNFLDQITSSKDPNMAFLKKIGQTTICIARTLLINSVEAQCSERGRLGVLGCQKSTKR
jgi:hypothetical protein